MSKARPFGLLGCCVIRRSQRARWSSRWKPHQKMVLYSPWVTLPESTRTLPFVLNWQW